MTADRKEMVKGALFIVATFCACYAWLYFGLK